jgi:hypothetical protein
VTHISKKKRGDVGGGYLNLQWQHLVGSAPDPNLIGVKAPMRGNQTPAVKSERRFDVSDLDCRNGDHYSYTG